MQSFIRGQFRGERPFPAPRATPPQGGQAANI
jgi:hypothetical protein